MANDSSSATFDLSSSPSTSMSAELAMVVGTGATSSSQDAAMVVVPDANDDEDLDDDQS